jgi:hypothetical protein
MKEGNLRKVVASTNVALDGVMEAPDRWFFPFWSEELSRLPTKSCLPAAPCF